MLFFFELFNFSTWAELWYIKLNFLELGLDVLSINNFQKLS